MGIRATTIGLALVLGLAVPATPTAQVFGNFTWQMLPYCNRVMLTLSSTPAGFTLDGSDDQCGTSRGSAFGVAVFTPTGTVALNFTIVSAPSGAGVHVSGIVDPGTGSGTWTDSAGNTGTFVLGGNMQGLPRRPVSSPSTLAPGSVTATEIADGTVGTAELADGSVTTDKLPDRSVYYTKIAFGTVGATEINSLQVQRRVGASCPAGQAMTAVNQDGTVACAPTGSPGPGSITSTQLADSAVTTTKIAANAVTAAKVDSSQVQLRVSASCPAGQLMTGVNTNGSVTCVAPAQPATNLECTQTAIQSFTIAAGASNFFDNPLCPAGYMQVTPYCYSSDAGVYSQGSGVNSNTPGSATFCAWNNTTGGSRTVFGGSTCCRVPAR